MAIQMEEALDQLPLPTLVELSITELQQYRAKVLSEGTYTVELVRRALVEQTDEAWEALEQCFGETVRVWIRSHPGSDVALRRDSEENYIAQTFARFWYAVRDQHLEFSTLPSALRYLHATLNGLLTDTLRSHLRQRTREVPLPEPGCPEEPGSSEEALESERLWEEIQKLLVNERERRLFFLLYSCGLKPREVVVRCPQEFGGVQEIYRLNTNIIERLRRNRDRLYYLLEGDA
jgi:DNA-directed RNA polymerase specialized sigma24 family protein